MFPVSLRLLYCILRQAGRNSEVKKRCRVLSQGQTPSLPSFLNVMCTCASIGHQNQDAQCSGSFSLDFPSDGPGLLPLTHPTRQKRGALTRQPGLCPAAEHQRHLQPSECSAPPCPTAAVRKQLVCPRADEWMREIIRTYAFRSETRRKSCRSRRRRWRRRTLRQTRGARRRTRNP